MVGFPGELGTATLTASQVDALAVAELRKELAARAVQDTTGTEADLRGRLKAWLRNPRHDGFRRAHAVMVTAPAPGLHMPPAPHLAPLAPPSPGLQIPDYIAAQVLGFSSDDDA